MANLKISVSKAGFSKSVSNFKKAVPTLMASSLHQSGESIVNNIKSRYNALVSPSSEITKRIAENISYSVPIEVDNGFFMGIGNMGELDSVSEVMAKSTGKVYHLWRLLEYGFGMRGGFRSDLYDIYPVYPTSGYGSEQYRHFGGTRRKGKFHSGQSGFKRPALVFYANGALIFAAHVRHPGALGHFFFTNSLRGWYTEDMQVIVVNLKRSLLQFLPSVNYKN